MKIGAPARATLAWLGSNWMRLLALFACVLVPLFLLGELSESIRAREAFVFDEGILRFMQRNANELLDRLMLLSSTLGSGLVVGAVDVLVCAALLLRRRWRDAAFWAMATGGAAAINRLAKLSFARVRPDLWPSLAPETSYSFPSGHAMQSMAMAAALIVLLWPTAARWPMLALGAAFTVVVGLSRVYLGVHFPSDVLAGWLASLAWVAGLSFLFYHHAVRRHRTAPLRNKAP